LPFPIIAYIFSGIIVAGVVTVIVGQTIWLKKLVTGEIGPEEFESGRPEWGSDPKVAGFSGRIGRRLVAAGEKILGEPEIEPELELEPEEEPISDEGE